MDKRLIERIDRVQTAIEEWLSPDNSVLKEAIDKSVQEGLFSFEDIKFQILALKKTLKKGELERWVKSSGVTNSEQDGSTAVLCLHAGNLPLVGLQDILAVVLSGRRYLGKLSKKDPYLPASFLNVLKSHQLVNDDWSTEIDELSEMKVAANAVMFSGATETVEPVIDTLTRLNLVTSSTPMLIRTAHFSMALIEDDKPETFKQLADVVLRYGGSGCRSVAMVVAPFGLNSKKCEFTDYVESFWLKNPQHKKPAPSLFHRFAYNRAVGIEQSWLDDFLIEETDLQPTEPFILHWVEGGLDRFNKLAKKHHKGLQSLYVTDPDTKLADGLPAPEMLSDAQQPPIWWTPDGQDPLKWLTTI